MRGRIPWGAVVAGALIVSGVGARIGNPDPASGLVTGAGTGAVDPGIPTTVPGANPYVIPPPTGGAVTRPPAAGSGSGPVVTLDDSGLPPLAPGRAAGSWERTGSLATPRALPVVAELADGRVLVAGGSTGRGATGSAEVYDPVDGTWAPTGSMHDPRLDAASTVLADGRVLVAGGATTGSGARSLRTAEVYDPSTGRWTVTGPLHTARRGTTAVRVAGGALVAGGADATGHPLASTELYDPADGSWRSGSPLHTARSNAAVTSLPGGGVLVAGGMGTSGFTATAERRDPATGYWSTLPDLPTPRAMDTATVLDDGRVLVAGSGSHGVVFDPVAASWTRTGGMGSVHAQAAAVRLADGRVLLAGGTTERGANAVTELYDPATNAWQRGADLQSPVGATAAVRLPNGAVLVAAGSRGVSPVRAAQVFGLPGQVEPFLRTPAEQAASLDADGSVTAGDSGHRPGSGSATVDRAGAVRGARSGGSSIWPVVGGIVAGVAVLAAIAALVVTRRRRSPSGSADGNA